MKTGYWYQQAAPWVSMSVMIGGMLSTSLLIFAYKFEKNYISPVAEEDNSLTEQLSRVP